MTELRLFGENWTVKRVLLKHLRRRLIQQIATHAILHKHVCVSFETNEISIFRYPVLYEESLNTVIIQEAIRYNKLLKIIVQTLRDLLKAIKGLVVMSEALERMSNSLYSNAVPAIWASKAYPSLKPLGTQNVCFESFLLIIYLFQVLGLLI